MRIGLTRFMFVIAVAFFVTSASFAFGELVHAQSFINPNQGQAMKITVLPKYPKAFERVSVTVEDFSRDISSSNISWSINGRSAARGVGMKNFSFETGALGSVSDVTVSVGGLSQTVSIRPTEVDIIWQAGSYTPPLYEGKALHTNQDPVTFLAEPFLMSRQGARTNPATLIYTWKQNGNVVQQASGYGRRSFTVQPSILAKPLNIEVEVANSTGDLVSVGSLSVGQAAPQLVVYENSPLYGLRMEHALNGKVFSFGDRTETTFTAVPFFFSIALPQSTDVTYSWSQNGVASTQKTPSVIFRAPVTAEGGGVASVSVGAKHATNYLQAANASWNIDFRKAVRGAGGL